MKKSSTCLLTTFPVILAILWKGYPAIVLMIAPKYLDDKLVHYLFNDDPQNHPVQSADDMPAVTIMTAHKANNVMELFSQNGYPKVARNLLTPLPQIELLTKLAGFNEGKTLRLINMTSDFDHYSPSCNGDKQGFLDEVATDCAQYIRKGMLTEEEPALRNMWAGFEAITDKSHLEILLGGANLSEWGDYKQNNLFMSNLLRTQMTAPTHCAPIDSLVIQMVGTKTWVFTSPLQLSTIPSIPMPTFFNLPTTDDELLSQMGEVRLMATGPGDVLYFGPNWCHAVVTEKGPNVMFNVRYMALDKVRNGPFNLFAKFALRLMTRKLGLLPQDNAVIQGPIYQTLNAYYKNCGQSDKVTYIMDMVKQHVTELGLV